MWDIEDWSGANRDVLQSVSACSHSERVYTRHHTHTRLITWHLHTIGEGWEKSTIDLWRKLDFPQGKGEGQTQESLPFLSVTPWAHLLPPPPSSSLEACSASAQRRSSFCRCSSPSFTGNNFFKPAFFSVDALSSDLLETPFLPVVSSSSPYPALPPLTLSEQSLCLKPSNVSFSIPLPVILYHLPATHTFVLFLNFSFAFIYCPFLSIFEYPLRPVLPRIWSGVF